MCVNYVTIHTQIYGERGFPLTATPLTLLDPDNPYLPLFMRAPLKTALASWAPSINIIIIIIIIIITSDIGCSDSDQDL